MSSANDALGKRKRAETGGPDANSGTVPNALQTASIEVVTEQTPKSDEHARAHANADMEAQGRTPGTMTGNSHSPLIQRFTRTNVLLQHRAINSSFLFLVGKGTLTRGTISRWLVQYIHYTRVYITFIAGLIARLILPFTLTCDDASGNGKMRQTLSTTTYVCLVNTLRHASNNALLLDQLAVKFGIHNLTDTPVAEPSAAIESLANLMTKTSAEAWQSDTEMPQGLVLVWAHEFLSYSGWLYAESVMPRCCRVDSKGRLCAVHQCCAEAEALCEQIFPMALTELARKSMLDWSAVVDTWADRLGVMEDQAKLKEAEQLWEQMLKIQADLWPNPEETTVSTSA